jgi:hypothetical protein
MIVVMPMTGGGFFIGAMKPAIASLIGHVLYGLFFVGILGKLNK